MKEVPQDPLEPVDRSDTAVVPEEEIRAFLRQGNPPESPIEAIGDRAADTARHVRNFLRQMGHPTADDTTSAASLRKPIKVGESLEDVTFPEAETGAPKPLNVTVLMGMLGTPFKINSQRLQQLAELFGNGSDPEHKAFGLACAKAWAGLQTFGTGVLEYQKDSSSTPVPNVRTLLTELQALNTILKTIDSSKFMPRSTGQSQASGENTSFQSIIELSQAVPSMMEKLKLFL